MTRRQWEGRCGLCRGELVWLCPLPFERVVPRWLYRLLDAKLEEAYVCQNPACRMSYGSTRSSFEEEKYRVTAG